MRATNPYYVDPNAGAIGSALATALFGNPALRMQAEQRRIENDLAMARAEQARASAGYDMSRTTGQDQKNEAASMFTPELVSSLFKPQAPNAPMVTAPNQETVGPDGRITTEAVITDARPRDPEIDPNALASIIAYGQLAGLDPEKAVNVVASMLGTDDQARRAFTMSGNNATDKSAFSEDAGQRMRDQNYDEEASRLAATIAGREKVAGINAGARRFAASASAGARVQAAKIGAGASTSNNVRDNQGQDRRKLWEVGSSITNNVADNRTSERNTQTNNSGALARTIAGQTLKPPKAPKPGDKKPPPKAPPPPPKPKVDPDDPLGLFK